MPKPILENKVNAIQEKVNQQNALKKKTVNVIPPVIDKPETLLPDQKTQGMIDKVNTFVSDEAKKATGAAKDVLVGKQTEDELIKGQNLQQEEADKAALEKSRIELYRDSTKALERGEEDFNNTIRQKNIDFLDLQEKNNQYVHNMTFARSGQDYGASLKGMQAVNTALSQARSVMEQAATVHEQSMKRLGEDYGQSVIEITRNLYRNVDDAKLKVYSKLNQMQLTGELETAEDLRAAHQALSDQYTKDLALYANTYQKSAEFLYNKYQADQAQAQQKANQANTINHDISKLQRVYVNGNGQKILDAQGKPIPYRDDVQTVQGTDGTIYEIDPVTKQVVGQYNIGEKVADIEANKNALQNVVAGSTAAVNTINKLTGTYTKGSNTYTATLQPDGGIKFNTAPYENQSLARGQCGEFVNDAIKAGMGDTFQEKQATVNRSKSTIPLPGMAFIQNTGKDPKTGKDYGHTGLIEQVYDYDGDGQPDAMDIVESNYSVGGGISRATIKKGDSRWNQIYQYGFYDPIAGQRTYTNPNAKADEFGVTEVSLFNSSDFKPEKASVADKARYSQFLQKKEKVMSDPNSTMEDILSVTAGYDTLTGGQSEKLEKSLQTYDQFHDLTGEVLKIGTYGPIIGKLRNMNPWDSEAKKLQAQLTALVPQMARGVFGEVGVLTDQDVARYQAILPNLQGTEKYNLAVMAMLNRAIANSVKNKLKVWAASKRDVSGFTGIYREYMDKAEQIEKQIGVSGGATGGSVSGSSIKEKYGYSPTRN